MLVSKVSYNTTQFIQTVLHYDNTIPYANVIEDFVVLKEINYTYMALSQKKYVQPNSSIVVNLSKCKRHCIYYLRIKKCLIATFIRWIVLRFWYLYLLYSVWV